MNKVFGASYAAVFIDKKEKKIKIVWKGSLTGMQFKLVLELVLELMHKYSIDIIAEDRSKLRLQQEDESDSWINNYFLPNLSRVSKYIIKDYPSSYLKNLFSDLDADNSPKYMLFSNHQEFENAFEIA